MSAPAAPITAAKWGARAVADVSHRVRVGAPPHLVRLVRCCADQLNPPAKRRHWASARTTRHEHKHGSFFADNHRLVRRQGFDADVAETGLAHPAVAVLPGEVETASAHQEHVEAG